MTVSEKRQERLQGIYARKANPTKKETHICNECGSKWNTISGIINHQRRAHK